MSSVTSVDRVSGLEHLYMSDCAISQIEAGAFVDLVHLRWLDLSDNRLRTLGDGTFAGLRLHQLFLNGNRRLALDGGRPFANLTVSGLYLHDCRLSRLDAGTFASLVGSLRVLWLSENQLSRLDPELSGLFQSLGHFRLANNRLHCNCELSWLWRCYDEQRRRRNGDELKKEAPECVSPESLRGRHFDELREDDLRCQAPTFADVEVTLILDDDDDVGQSPDRRRMSLRCTATGDPTPDVRWIGPTSGLRLPTFATQKDAVEHFIGEALLVLNNDDVRSTSAFTCVASNAVGNATLVVRRVRRTWNDDVDTTENDEVATKYGIDNVEDVLDIKKYRLLIQRNRTSAQWTRKACGELSRNGRDSAELCGGGDRRLRASVPVDRRRVKSLSVSVEVRQYGVEYVIGAVLMTALLTLAFVVMVAAACMRYRGRFTTADVLHHPHPVTDDARGRTASATTLGCNTVAYLTRKSLS